MSNPVMLRLVDPHNYIVNQRAEFRLSEGFYKSNLKLLNVGFASPSTTNGYGLLNGSLAPIKQISLMDGSKVLDSLNDFNIYQGFRAYNVNNKRACDLDLPLIKTRMGNFSNPPFDADDETYMIDIWEESVTVPSPDTDVATTPTAYLDLSDMFPMLRNLRRIHTGLLKNFRIVIEFQQDLAIYQPDEPTTARTTTQPLIAVQQIMDPNAAQEYLRDFKGVQYYSLENDRVLVNAISGVTATNHPVQTNNFRMNGFNNKTVNRFLISKNSLESDGDIALKATVPVSKLYGKSASECQYKQRLQCRINGSNLLPSNGITSQSEQLARLNDTFGVCVSFAGCNIPDFVDSGNHTTQPEDERYGHLDYYGLNVANKKVNDLQFTYEREAVHMPSDPDQTKSRYNQALNFNVMGEVLKSLVPNGNGGYSIIYN